MSVVIAQKSQRWKHHTAHFQPISFPHWKCRMAAEERGIAVCQTSSDIQPCASFSHIHSVLSLIRSWWGWWLTACLVNVFGSGEESLKENPTHLLIIMTCFCLSFHQLVKIKLQNQCVCECDFIYSVHLKEGKTPTGNKRGDTYCRCVIPRKAAIKKILPYISASSHGWFLADLALTFFSCKAQGLAELYLLVNMTRVVTQTVGALSNHNLMNHSWGCYRPGQGFFCQQR